MRSMCNARDWRELSCRTRGTQTDGKHMAEFINQESDAQILWEDVVAILTEDGLAPSTLAMLQSCEAIGLTDDTLTISAKSGFVRRNVERNADLIRGAIERAAFQPMQLAVDLNRGCATASSVSAPTAIAQPRAAQPIPAATAPAPTPTVSMPAHMPQANPAPAAHAPVTNQTTISREDLERLLNPTAEAEREPEAEQDALARRRKNPLVQDIAPADSQLTFDTFVEGEENQLAFQAAKAVANGSNGYNPLFIYGGPGMGKTHLLKAIQNYLAVNDPDRICVYRNAREFVSDYTDAMVDTSRDVKRALEQNYHDIDVLIIDDIQGFRGAAKSINFFFDTFNYLTSNGKQIVLAADESPAELGLEERVTTRLDSGVTLSIQVPNYELKLGLIKAFYERMKADAIENGQHDYDGTLDDASLEFMAQRAGASIRTIKSFCQLCLLEATSRQARGEEFTREDISQIATKKWGADTRTFTIEQIQKFVEQRYSVSHADLISNKRNKGLMEPRHVAVWLARELTDSTLAQIGERFGGRTHATVKHSIKWVEDRRHEDRVVHDKIARMKEDLMAGA